MSTADGNQQPEGWEINTFFLINIIFEGREQSALEIARRYPQTSVRLTPKSIERYLIIEAIRNGASNKDIVSSLSTDEDKISISRVRRLRKEVQSGKYEE